MLSTPGYVKSFGDAATPTTVGARRRAHPGQRQRQHRRQRRLAALDLWRPRPGRNAGALGAQRPGRRRRLDLRHRPGAAGASLTLDTGGAFDLASFAQDVAPAFTGSIAVRSGAGDLDLDAGQTLKAANVQLVADGGLVDIGGTIDVSGVNGGAINLYGARGVHLLSTAMLDAHANGYGLTDTRQASGGNVTLGVDGAGAITVDPGAMIDVAALNPENRLVPMQRSNGAYYSYVAGDQGGTITFRAPVSGPNGAETVNIDFAGAVDGAGSVVVEGFQRFDLASSPMPPIRSCWGVCIANGQATLNLAASPTGQANPLSDPNGPLVQFVQNFNVAGSYGDLGGLASQANFHARPGIELDYSGDIVLASNWNLGAGTVKVAGAVAAGLMAPVPGSAGQYYVLPGDEASGVLPIHHPALPRRRPGDWRAGRAHPARRRRPRPEGQHHRRLLPVPRPDRSQLPQPRAGRRPRSTSRRRRRLQPSRQLRRRGPLDADWLDANFVAINFPGESTEARSSIRRRPTAPPPTRPTRRAIRSRSGRAIRSAAPSSSRSCPTAPAARPRSARGPTNSSPAPISPGPAAGRASIRSRPSPVPTTA